RRLDRRMPGPGQQCDVNRAGDTPPLRFIALSARRWAKAPARQGPGLKPTLSPYVFVPARLAGRPRPAILKSIEPVGAGPARPRVWDVAPTLWAAPGPISHRARQV